jgi:hypothetical protein
MNKRMTDIRFFKFLLHPISLNEWWTLFCVLVASRTESIHLWDLSITDVALVDGWRDNHVLIFYTIIYYRYTEHTDELQLDDLQVAGWDLPFAGFVLRVFISKCAEQPSYVHVSARLKKLRSYRVVNRLLYCSVTACFVALFPWERVSLALQHG